MNISIPTDSDGFYSLKCSYCKDIFKTSTVDYEMEELFELYCPYCGLINEKSSFIPDQVTNHGIDIAENYLSEILNQSMKKIKRRSRNSKNLKFNYKTLKKEKPRELVEVDDELKALHLNCCNKNIKVHANEDFLTVYCPYCGVN